LSFHTAAIPIKIFLSVLNTTLKSSVSHVNLWSERNKIQVTQLLRFRIVPFVRCESREQHESDECSTSKNHPSLKNTKEKLFKTNAEIWFNKMCRLKQLTPKYIRMNLEKSKGRQLVINNQL
jgi:hypothetical protein